MKNLYLLPTDKPSRLIKFKDETNLLLSSLPSIKGQGFNIYITSDEKIKENDYVIVSCSEVNIGEVRIVTGYYNEQFLFDDKSQIHMDYCKKIILTTDEDLIQNGVQAIDDDFLERFVKNPSCEEVEVIKSYNDTCKEQILNECEIIIPKEEPKPIHKFNNGRGATLCVKCYVIISEGITKELYCEKCKLKQKTLEEFIKEITKNFKDEMSIKFTTGGIKLGAKYMQEKLFSEEDMIDFAEYVASYSDKNRNIHNQMLHAKSKYDGAERTIDLLEIWLKESKTK
jgi:hypothetical protein